MSLATFSYRQSLAARLQSFQLVPQNVEMDWLVITAATTGSRPEEQNITVEIAFGNAQPQLYTTPVAFTDMRDRQTCAPFGGGITVTVAAQSGMEILGQGGLT